MASKPENHVEATTIATTTTAAATTTTTARTTPKTTITTTTAPVTHVIRILSKSNPRVIQQIFIIYS